MCSLFHSFIYLLLCYCFFIFIIYLFILLYLFLFTYLFIKYLFIDLYHSFTDSLLYMENELINFFFVFFFLLVFLWIHTLWFTKYVWPLFPGRWWGVQFWMCLLGLHRRELTLRLFRWEWLEIFHFKALIATLPIPGQVCLLFYILCNCL